MRRQRVGSSLSEDVYGQLHDDIVSGVVGPGERLLVSPLSTRFGVSLSVVREALTRLAGQGLVRLAPQIGFSVMPVGRAELIDLTRARVDVEMAIVRRALADGDLGWEMAVVAAHHALVRLPDEPGARRRTAHREFHDAIAAGCGSPTLRRIRTELFHQAQIYWMWAFGDEGRPEAGPEHRALFDAVVARDADRAAGLVAHHVQAASDWMLTHAFERTPLPR